MYGPRYPMNPTGDAQVMVSTSAGGRICQLEFEDGYIYEISMPVAHGRHLSWNEIGRILYGGVLMNAFTVDDRHYLAVWINRGTHNRMYPNGPLPFRHMNEDDLAAERRLAEEWVYEGLPAPSEPDLRIAG